MPKHRYSAKVVWSVCLLSLLLPQTGWSQSIVVDRNITFGHVSIRDNSVPRDIQLLPTGIYIADPEYIFYAAEPELAHVILSGQPANALINITFDLSNPQLVAGSGSIFTLINPFTEPPVIVTDGGGNASFYVGATLRSDGSGTPFLDGNYTGNIFVTATPD